MFNELVFIDGTPSSSEPYLGGDPYLPTAIAWPKGSEGGPLLHLATFPAAFINKYTNFNLDSQLVISIFTPYSKTSDAYIETIMTEGGKVIAYKPSVLKMGAYADPITPSKKITVFENPNEDSNENGIAKIGGIPAWIQDDENLKTLDYALQINSSRLNKAAPYHKGILVGGIGYLMLKKNIPCQDIDAGKFLIQTS